MSPTRFSRKNLSIGTVVKDLITPNWRPLSALQKADIDTFVDGHTSISKRMSDRIKNCLKEEEKGIARKILKSISSERCKSSLETWRMGLL